MVSHEIKSSALMKALGKLPKNIQNNVMVGATRAGAIIVRDDARGIVHKKSHNLEKSIAVIKMKSHGTVTQFAISPSRGGAHDGWYGRFVELGTSHSQPFPFIRPAIERNVANVLGAVKEYMETRLDQEVRKAK